MRIAAMNGGGIDRKHGNGMGMQWDVKIARAWQGLEGKGAARALHRRVLQRARQGTDSQRRSKETLAMA